MEERRRQVIHNCLRFWVPFLSSSFVPLFLSLSISFFPIFIHFSLFSLVTTFPHGSLFTKNYSLSPQLLSVTDDPTWSFFSRTFYFSLFFLSLSLSFPPFFQCPDGRTHRLFLRPEDREKMLPLSSSLSPCSLSLLHLTLIHILFLPNNHEGLKRMTTINDHFFLLPQTSLFLSLLNFFSLFPLDSKS